MGNKRKIALAVTDFPEPLSPTKANVSPRAMVKLTPSVTGRACPAIPKPTDRLSIFNTQSFMRGSVVNEGQRHHVPLHR
ncbi:Uncharacterised protein [Vibrio cholerae]|nr:Uncharacterised protein [Vibrio cholerae]